MHRLFLLALVSPLVAGIAGCDRAPPPESPAQAAELFQEERLRAHIQTLAADEFEGRGPSTPGEEKATTYLRQQFEKLGLRPGNGDSFFQEVPLVTITARPGSVLRIEREDQRMSLAYGPDQICWTKRVTESVDLDHSEMVFVGYGIVAPEFDWDDYQGIDMAGKTAVILVNDPGLATHDETLFRGTTMTYYGRWTYKYEEAARQGAAAAILVHQTHAAGYPWAVVQGSWSGPQYDLVAADGNSSRVAVEGWITDTRAREVFAMGGHDFEALRKEAATRASKAVALGMTASLHLDNELEHSLSRNVVARIEGSERPDETIVFMAHWDHLGKNDGLEGDAIYNGAVDNATGCAGLLELARVFAHLDPGPERSLLFLATTAEESGLLGSQYYAEHPLAPLEKTVAALNMDSMNVLGPTRDVTVVGFGASELEELLAASAAQQERILRGETSPEKGYFYRSDHFNFAKRGVPVLYAEGGEDLVGREEGHGKRMADEYLNERYHKPADEYDPAWDLRGMVEDLWLYFRVGKTLAFEESFPEWYPGTEFRARREETAAARLRP